MMLASALLLREPNRERLARFTEEITREVKPIGRDSYLGREAKAEDAANYFGVSLSELVEVPVTGQYLTGFSRQDGSQYESPVYVKLM